MISNLKIKTRMWFVIIAILAWSPSIFAQDAKTMAILDFEGLGIKPEEVKALTNRLRTKLVQSGAYDVTERGKMQEILDEQGFQMSGCTSEGCMVEAGHLLGVRYMLAGSISLVGSTYSVEMRAIDVETGKIIQTASYDYKGLIDDLMNVGMQRAVDILVGKETTPVTPTLKAEPAMLSIATMPKDAEVLINNASRELTPLNLTDIPPNKQIHLEIRKENYVSHVADLTLNSDKNPPLRITLSPQTGLLKVNGSPRGFKLLIDGKSIGNAILDNLKYPIGKIEIIAKKPEYRPFKQTIEINAGQTAVVNFKLQSIPKSTAPLFSAIVPGSGQFYQHRLVHGLVFLAATAGAGVM
ncbi:MAG: PEGA domain-containing protein, partial [Candidatus Marinimicrobia bacterium]|nr:PEGA domain-containing protein [Candidatus Neomarinimicrobiota bacterium]